MSNFLKIFIFFLFILSNIYGEHSNIRAKDAVSGATFEMKFSTSKEIFALSCLEITEHKNYFLNHKIYQVVTSNLPIDTVYSIYSINLLNQSTLIDNFTTQNGTDLRPVKRTEGGWDAFSEKSWCINKNFINGEPFRLKLISKESKTCLILKFIPNPIEYEWKDGAKIYMELKDRSANHYTFYGIGFKPNEKLSFINISGHEKMDFKFPADEEGSVTIMISPAVIGKKGGNSTFLITRENTKNQATLKYFWGEKAIRNKG